MASAHLDQVDGAEIDARKSAASPDPATTPLKLHASLRIGRATTGQDRLRLLSLADFTGRCRASATSPRTRPDHLLVWVTKGQIRLEFPRHRHCLSAGELRFIPAGTAFAMQSAPGAEGHVALIPRAAAAAARPPLPDNDLSAQIGEDGAQLLATLSELASEACPPDPATRQCLMNLLALRLSRLAPKPAAAQADAPPSEARSLVEQFLSLAATRLGTCAAIAELAEELQTNAATIDRACIAARGRRAIELLHELRLQRAVDLLRNSRHGAAQIADELGYSSHAHFTRAFVAATGRSPEAFRAQPR